MGPIRFKDDGVKGLERPTCRVKESDRSKDNDPTGGAKEPIKIPKKYPVGKPYCQGREEL